MSYDSGDRVSYETIKALALDAYYDACRDNALMRGWSHREVLGSVDYAFEAVYESQIENLMLCVVQLVLSGGWYQEAEQKMRSRISHQLATEGIDNLLREIPQEEADRFKHDLNVLKLI